MCSSLHILSEVHVLVNYLSKYLSIKNKEVLNTQLVLINNMICVYQLRNYHSLTHSLQYSTCNVHPQAVKLASPHAHTYTHTRIAEQHLSSSTPPFHATHTTFLTHSLPRFPFFNTMGQSPSTIYGFFVTSSLTY